MVKIGDIVTFRATKETANTAKLYGEKGYPCCEISEGDPMVGIVTRVNKDSKPGYNSVNLKIIFDGNIPDEWIFEVTEGYEAGQYQVIN